MSPGGVAGTAALGAACGPWVRAAVLRHATADGKPRGTCPCCRCPILPVGSASPRAPGPVARRARPWVSTLPVSGRCPACRHRLGPAGGAVELGLAVVFAALAARVDSVLVLAALCWFAAVGVALAMVDVAVHRLPDRLTALAGTGLLAALAGTALVRDEPGALARAVLGGVVLFTGLLALLLLSPGSLGFGDCKLVAGLGAALGWFGWSVVVTGTVAAFALAAVHGLLLVALGRAGRRDPMPFGPYLLLGALGAVLVG